MSAGAHSAKPLPHDIVGGKRDIYQGLIDMSAQQVAAGTAGERQAYFRRDELAASVNLSPVRVSVVLRWLDDEGYLSYTPGGPGRLSKVVFAPRAETV